jgi:hypothetical protein
MSATGCRHGLVGGFLTKKENLDRPRFIALVQSQLSIYLRILYCRFPPLRRFLGRATTHARV